MDFVVLHLGNLTYILAVPPFNFNATEYILSEHAKRLRLAPDDMVTQKI